MTPKGVVPSVGLTPPGKPLISQLTVVTPLLFTVAVKVWVALVRTFMLWGATLTDTPGRFPVLIGAAPTPPQPVREITRVNPTATHKLNQLFMRMCNSETFELTRDTVHSRLRRGELQVWLPLRCC